MPILSVALVHGRLVLEIQLQFCGMFVIAKRLLLSCYLPSLLLEFDPKSRSTREPGCRFINRPRWESLTMSQVLKETLDFCAPSRFLALHFTVVSFQEILASG
jgi:hypothetical protein